MKKGCLSIARKVASIGVIYRRKEVQTKKAYCVMRDHNDSAMCANVGLVTVWGIGDTELDLLNWTLLSTHECMSAEKLERQIIRIQNWKERINQEYILKYILAISYSDLGWANEKLHPAPGRRADGA